MPGWLDDVLALRALPVRRQIAALDALVPDPGLALDEVLSAFDAATDHPDVHRPLTDSVVRLLGPGRWMSLLDALNDRDDDLGLWWTELFRDALGPRLVPAAIELLETEPHGALCWLASAADADLGRGRPRILALAEDPDPETSASAALIAVRQGWITPSVVRGIARALGRAADLDPSNYDEQVDVENMLWTVARAGRQLADAAPALVPLLRSDAPAWRTAAAHAAIGLDARPLLPVIEDALGLARGRTGLDAEIESAVLGYASWWLGSGDAMPAPSASFVVQSRLASAFAVSAVDDRLLAALRVLADDPAWTGTICDVLAGFGAAAASVVASLPPPGADARLAWVTARWRCGVAGVEETRMALEADLSGWDVYAELALVDPAAEAGLREHVRARHDGNAFVHALLARPEIVRRLEGELWDAGYDDLLYTAWRRGWLAG